MKLFIYLLLVAVAAFSAPTKGEYYLDSDPGVGNATAVTLATAGDTTSFQVPLTGVSVGLHTIYLRTFDAVQGWGNVWGTPVVVNYNKTISKVSGGEYFFDTDPGVGNGTVVSADWKLDTLTESVPLTGISTGLHTLYHRVKNEAGQWSNLWATPVVVNYNKSISKVSGGEYFFDTDPGVGKGTVVSADWKLDTLTESVPLTGISTGLHTLYHRVKNEAGQWSNVWSTPVVVNSNKTMNTISGAEYFVDTDPGVGKGTALTATWTVDSVIATAPLTGISEGTHTLYVRVKNGSGQWSNTWDSKLVVKYAPIDIVLNNLMKIDTVLAKQVVGTLSTTVFNKSEKHTYTVVGGNFTISGDTLKSVDSLKAVQVAQIRSTDVLGRAIEKSFSLVNKFTPTDIALSKTVFNDPVAVGATIGTLTTKDKNTDETFTYSLTVGADAFTIVKDTVKAKTVFSKADTIVVRTTDSRGLFFDKQFVILRKSAPTDIVLKDLTKVDTINAGNVVGVLSSVDFNIEEKHTYTIVGVSNFTLSGDTLKSVDSLKAATVVKIKTTDSYGLSFEKSFTLVNKFTPTDIALSKTIIIGTLAVGGTVGTLTTTDKNTDETFTYSLTVGADAFTIVKDTLKAKTVFNKADTIVVRTTDSRGLFFDKQFVIVRKSAPTDIVLKDLTKVDTINAGKVVGVLSSVDFNTEETFTYSVVSGTVTISGDTLKSVDSLKAASVAKIKTTDSYGLSFEKSFTLVNKFTPTDIALTKLIIPDSAVVGAVITRASTVDKNSDETWKYSVISGPVSFVGDTLKAKVKLTSLTPNYPITIRSTDSRGLFVDKSFSLIVIKMNGMNYYDTVTTSKGIDSTKAKTLIKISPKQDTVVTTTFRSLTIDTTWGVADSLVLGKSVSKSKTFKSVKITYDTTSTRLDTLIYQSGIKGDFTGDGLLTVADLGFMAQLWKKTKAKGVINPAYELAPYTGLFPTITVKPDGKFDYQDLRVFVDFCWYNAKTAKALAPLPQMTKSRSIVSLVATAEPFGDSVNIVLSGNLAGISAASCEISAGDPVIWNKGRSLESAGTVFPMTETAGGVSRFSVASVDPIREDGELMTLTVAKSQFVNGLLNIRYALLDEQQNVIGAGSVDVTIAKAIKETVAKGVPFNVYPNPSTSVDRGGEGFTFVVNTDADAVVSNIKVTLFSSVGSVVHRAGFSEFAVQGNGVYTHFWDGDEISGGAYLAIVEITDKNGTTRHTLMVGAAK